LLTDKKSSPKKMPVTPFIDRIFLSKVFFVSSLLTISKGPLFETGRPGINFNELGFGVF
jgi:hypothetical protein